MANRTTHLVFTGVVVIPKDPRLLQKRHISVDYLIAADVKPLYASMPRQSIRQRQCAPVSDAIAVQFHPLNLTARCES